MALIAVLSFILTSCDSLIYDDEGDCEVKYKIQFRYEMNLKWADAFPSEVNSVNLYVFDSKGVFVKEFIGRGEALSKPGYYMDLDLPAGVYQFVAWCGLANEGTEMESFTVPQPVTGVTTIDEITCLLNAEKKGETDYSDKRLYFLYHGYLEASLPDSQDGAEYMYTVYLTKDTNHIRIILHEIDGDMEADDYEFRIEAANGFMAYDNTLLGNTKVTYMPWDQQADELGVGKSDVSDELPMNVKGVVADFSVARMMAEHKNDMLLTITSKKTQETVIAKVPVIQYALLSKEYYEMAYRHTMTDQEFLDREDEYVLTFFLVNGKWLDSYIYIHSWRVVLHNYDIES